MTKEELAKKKGMKAVVEHQTPAEKLVTVLEPPKPVVDIPVIKEKEKRSVGKPKKRKDGDKKMSFWIDADLVDKVYSNLKYGDTVNDLINRALKDYLGRIS